MAWDIRMTHNEPDRDLSASIVATDDKLLERLQTYLQQLILMRETGPKRASWHAARMRMIWRLHREIERLTAHQSHEDASEPEQ